MMRALLLALALAGCASTTNAKTETSDAVAAGPETSIPFANLGGIRSWRPGPNRTLLIEGVTGRWYQATFFGTCLDLPYTETIAVDANDPSGRVDRFSAVYVRGQRCPFRSLVEVPDPDKPAEAAAPAEPR